MPSLFPNAPASPGAPRWTPATLATSSELLFTVARLCRSWRRCHQHVMDGLWCFSSVVDGNNIVSLNCLVDSYYLDLEDKAVVVMSGVGAPNIVESGRCVGHPRLHSDEIASCWPTRRRGWGRWRGTEGAQKEAREKRGASKRYREERRGKDRGKWWNRHVGLMSGLLWSIWRWKAWRWWQWSNFIKFQ